MAEQAGGFGPATAQLRPIPVREAAQHGIIKVKRPVGRACNQGRVQPVATQGGGAGGQGRARHGGAREAGGAGAGPPSSITRSRPGRIPSQCSISCTCGGGAGLGIQLASGRRHAPRPAARQLSRARTAPAAPTHARAHLILHLPQRLVLLAAVAPAQQRIHLIQKDHTWRQLGGQGECGAAARGEGQGETGGRWEGTPRHSVALRRTSSQGPPIRCAHIRPPPCPPQLPTV